jgi:arsenate reductase (thioredoxin)
MNKIKVLFLCTHNSARSQMAEGLLRHYYGERYEAYSAGATPTNVNPLAVTVMAELGIDISGQFSKSIEEFRRADIDLVVTVCKNTPKLFCPFCSTPLSIGRPDIIRSNVPNAKEWFEYGFDDPSDVGGSEEEKVRAFRSTRDEIKNWILSYFAK